MTLLAFLSELLKIIIHLELGRDLWRKEVIGGRQEDWGVTKGQREGPADFFRSFWPKAPKSFPTNNVEGGSEQ